MQQLQCPKCNAPMELVQVESTQVDRCTSCRGLWFDALEDQDVRGKPGAETLDVPPSTRPPAGPERRAIDLNCPRCKSPLIRMVDRMGRRVQYESCPRCHGKFLDAGEFRALEPRSLTDAVRRLFGGKQRKG